MNVRVINGVTWEQMQCPCPCKQWFSKSKKEPTIVEVLSDVSIKVDNEVIFSIGDKVERYSETGLYWGTGIIKSMDNYKSIGPRLHVKMEGGGTAGITGEVINNADYPNHLKFLKNISND